MRRNMLGLTSFDSQESMWLDRQLEYVESEIFEYDYPEYKARTLIPTPDINAAPFAKTVTYRMYNRVGMFKLITASGRDLPRIDLYAQEHTAKVGQLGASYGWTTSDIRASIHNNTNIESFKAQAAREAHLASENRLAWHGDSDANIQGFIGHPNTIRVTLPNDGAGTATSFYSKISTPERIYRDLNTLASASFIVTNGIERANTILLPVRDYGIVSSTKYSETETILQFFLRNNPQITLIDWLPELRGAAANGNDVYMAYNRNPTKLKLSIPMEFTERPPQERGLEVIVPCEATCGGVIIYKPLSVAYCQVSDSAVTLTDEPSSDSLVNRGGSKKTDEKKK